MPVLEGIEFTISKLMGRAIIDHSMIDDGDKVAVAVSGGKDSLTLLNILNDRRKFVPIKYDISAVHVDFGYHSGQIGDLRRCISGMKIPFHVIRSAVLKKTPPDKINCFWCSWNRRKELFLAADRLKCNKIAFGHHKDDIAQTMLMNLFFHGEISTMCPRQELFGGKIVIIRPMAYVDEKLIARFAAERKFKPLSCLCPHSDISKRRKVARVIAQMSKICPEVTTNILKSTRRIKKDYLG